MLVKFPLSRSFGIFKADSICGHFCAVMPEKTSKKRVRILTHLLKGYA